MVMRPNVAATMEIRDMQILAIISGEYGQRHVNNIQENGPSGWQIEVWQAPAVLPPIIDYPEDYLPDTFPASDIILSFAEHKGVAELLPEIAKLSGAKAVIVAVDNEAWLPRGLARQLRGWLENMDVACATPKPLCTLTENDYGVARGQRIPYESDWISTFAQHFGQPELKLTIDENARLISGAQVTRDAVCGCARYVAENLIGISVDEAEEKAGLLHHHYPCMAAMGNDADYGDTLMHISGNVIKDAVAAQVKTHRQIQYFRPAGRSEAE
jgi:hypothetical protein